MSSSGSTEYKFWFEGLMPNQHQAVVEFLGGGEIAVKGAEVIFSSWIVCFSLIALALLGRMALSTMSSKEGISKYYADESLSMRNVFELYVGFIKDLSDDLVGRKNTKIFFWFFGGLFLYILSCNLLGLLPNATSPSTSISNNIAMSLTVVVFFTIVGIRRQGFKGFFGHMMGPLLPLALIIFPIEFMGTFLIRPASLALRLAGNMNGDHTVLGVTYGLSPYILPIAAYGLGLFVSVVQSFVFTLLTVIYVVLSLEHDEH